MFCYCFSEDLKIIISRFPVFKENLFGLINFIIRAKSLLICLFMILSDVSKMMCSGLVYSCMQDIDKYNEKTRLRY